MVESLKLAVVDGPLLDFQTGNGSMNRYKPGASVRTSLVSTLLGVYTDPTSPTVVMHLPDGTSTTGTPVRDSAGLWHADFVVPFGTPTGIGVYRWRSTGVAASANALAEERFEVTALDF